MTLYSHVQSHDCTGSGTTNLTVRHKLKVELHLLSGKVSSWLTQLQDDRSDIAHWQMDFDSANWGRSSGDLQGGDIPLHNYDHLYGHPPPQIICCDCGRT